MTEVVSAEAGEGHAKSGVCIAGVGGPPLLEGNDSVLPITPVLGGDRPDSEVRLLVEQSVVSSDQVTVPFAVGNTGPETSPLLGEEPACLVVKPMDVAGARHRDRDEDQLGDPLGRALGIGQA